MSERHIRGAAVALSIIAATYLAANGIDVWGLLIFLAIVTL